MSASNITGTLALATSSQLYVEATDGLTAQLYSQLEAGELKDARSAQFPHDRITLKTGIVKAIVEGQALSAGPTSCTVANNTAVISVSLPGFKKAVVRMFSVDELKAALKLAEILDAARKQIGEQIRQAFGQTNQQAEKPARPPQGNQGKREDKRPAKPNGRPAANLPYGGSYSATPDQRPHTTFSDLPEITDEVQEARVEAIANELVAAVVPHNPSAEEVIATDEDKGTEAALAPAPAAVQSDLSFEELVDLLGAKGREFVVKLVLQKAGHTLGKGRKVPGHVVTKILEQRTQPSA